MADERDRSPIAPARRRSGNGTRMNTDPAIGEQGGGAEAHRGSFASRFRKADHEGGGSDPLVGSASTRSSEGRAGPRQVRQAKLRLVQVEPWSVMKAAFVLSVAIGIVTVVAVAVVWGVLGAAGLWDSVNSIVQDSLQTNSGTPFEIEKYLGTSRILGFTMLVAVADVVLITAIATLGAFLYNLAATLVGGIEVTFAEDK